MNKEKMNKEKLWQMWQIGDTHLGSWFEGKGKGHISGAVIGGRKVIIMDDEGMAGLISSVVDTAFEMVKAAQQKAGKAQEKK